MFGLQRTCTNVVLKGIKKNFRMISRERGREWKHGRVRKSADDIPILVFCFREPFAWLSSMYRWSFSGDRHGCPHFCKEWSFTEFLARRHYNWPTPVDRWNDLNRHYLNWVQDHPERGIVVRSEDMMSPKDARRQYLRIGEKFGLERTSDQIHVFRRRVNQSQKLLPEPMDFSYFTERLYLDQYPGEVRDFLAERIDSWVTGQLSYSGIVQSSAKR